jgi:outer membrane lipoprotein carrier protein
VNISRYASMLVLVCSASGTAYCAEPADELIALLNKMDSFQGHFSQNIKSSTGEKISNTQGQVVIRRPDRFYWKSQKPDPIIVVADGKYLWTYDIDLQQATKQSQKNALKNSPATLLAGATHTFKDDFTIAYAKPGACKSGQDHCFSLKPKQKDTTFKNIYIGFTQDKLVEVRMSDPLGQNVYTVFSDVKVNGAVNNSLFQFMPPKGVDVIHYD